jgi:hypothetical protein
VRTRARDKIALSSGGTPTLGEALDEGLVELRRVEPGRYVAREVGGDLFWEVNRTLYESRARLPVGAALTDD